MKEIVFLINEAEEGGYTARALGESIFTEAETMEELKKIFWKYLNVILIIQLKSQKLLIYIL